MSLESYFYEVRQQFPALTQKVREKRLAYLDSAATSLKPQIVIDRILQYYSFENANVHRGAHYLSDRATRSFEEGRETVQKFLNAASADEIVFTKGTTESINLVASSYVGEFLVEGDEILLTDLEHHANIVPWQLIAEKKKLKINVSQSRENGELDLKDFKNKLSSRTKFVAVTGSSNTLGTRPPLEQMIPLARKVGAKVLVDGAQLVLQKKVDVQSLDCDFLVFSGHKIFAPTGVGVLYGKKALLDKMPPYQGGGSMISQVCFSKTTFNDVPFRFEAGTPHIEGVIGLKTALDFFASLDIKMIETWEQELLERAVIELGKIDGLKMYGMTEDKGPILSFNLGDFHHSDVASLIDHDGVAVRAGHHCTQPLMSRLGITGTLRASFSIYNNLEDVQQLAASIKKAQEILT